MSELARDWLGRSADWLEVSLLGTPLRLIGFFGVSVALNVLAVMLMFVVASDPTSLGIEDNWLMVFWMGVIGAILDLISARLTLRILKGHHRPDTLRTVVLRVWRDIGLAVGFLLLNWLLFSFGLAFAIAVLDPEVDLLVADPDFLIDPDILFAFLFPINLLIDLPLASKVVSLATAAMPTTFYLVAGVLVLAARISPSWLRTLLSNSIYLITTDSRPVMAQLGDLFGTVTAFTVALAGYLRSMAG